MGVRVPQGIGDFSEPNVQRNYTPANERNLNFLEALLSQPIIPKNAPIQPESLPRNRPFLRPFSPPTQNGTDGNTTARARPSSNGRPAVEPWPRARPPHTRHVNTGVVRDALEQTGGGWGILDKEQQLKRDIASRTYELRRTIALLQQERRSLSVYYGRLKSKWDELEGLRPVPKCTCGRCTCGVGQKVQTMREEERVLDFLMGLDDENATVRYQILSIVPMPALGRAYSMVEASGEDNCAKNHGRQQDLQDRRCSNCGKTGHAMETCYDVIGYPDHRSTTPSTSGTKWGRY